MQKLIYQRQLAVNCSQKVVALETAVAVQQDSNSNRMEW